MPVFFRKVPLNSSINHVHWASDCQPLLYIKLYFMIFVTNGILTVAVFIPGNILSTPTLSFILTDTVKASAFLARKITPQSTAQIQQYLESLFISENCETNFLCYFFIRTWTAFPCWPGYKKKKKKKKHNNCFSYIWPIFQVAIFSQNHIKLALF